MAATLHRRVSPAACRNFAFGELTSESAVSVIQVTELQDKEAQAASTKRVSTSFSMRQTNT
jgi:hypothetical protein